MRIRAIFFFVDNFKEDADMYADNDIMQYHIDIYVNAVSHSPTLSFPPAPYSKSEKMSSVNTFQGGARIPFPLCNPMISSSLYSHGYSVGSYLYLNFLRVNCYKKIVTTLVENKQFSRLIKSILEHLSHTGHRLQNPFPYLTYRAD